MRQQLRRAAFPAPVDAPRLPLTADQMATALVRAAMATGELSQLAYRYEAAIKGLCTLRARWVALAALLALHQEVEIDAIAQPLGCGFRPLRVLAGCRGSIWWDEALVHRVFVDLVDPAPAVSIDGFKALRRSIADVLAERLDPQFQREGTAYEG
jgi:hypothetical protein